MADKGEGARQATILSYSSGKPTSPDSKVLYIKHQLCTRHWGAEAASSVLSAEAQIHVGKSNGEGGRNIRATAGPQTMSQTNTVGLGVDHLVPGTPSTLSATAAGPHENVFLGDTEEIVTGTNHISGNLSS